MIKEFNNTNNLFRQISDTSTYPYKISTDVTIQSWEKCNDKLSIP